MADTRDGAQSMTEADIEPARPGDTLRASAPTKSTGSAASEPIGRLSSTEAKQAILDGAGRVQQQAADKARAIAVDSKGKAVDAIGQVSKLLNDAAGDIDSQLGEQYGQYARSAADAVASFANGLQNKDVEALLDDARGLVRRSPAVAVGLAATIGFVLARVVQSGIESERA